MGYKVAPEEKITKVIWVLGSVLVVVLIALAIRLLLPVAPPPPADLSAAARRWAARAGIQVKGVDCQGSRCTFGTPGQPFDAVCDLNGCSLLCGSAR